LPKQGVFGDKSIWEDVMTDTVSEDPTEKDLDPDAAGRANDIGMACLVRMDLDGGLAQFAAVEAALRYAPDPAARVQWARALNGLGFIELMDAKRLRAGVDEPDKQTEWAVRWGLKQALARFDQALAIQADPRLRRYADGNKAYTLALLGREQEARDLFRRLFETGGRDAYDGQLEDLNRHPVQEDQAVARLLEDIWSDVAGAD
jgi:tetratricopeptide (TPR) repeat protein